MPAITAIPAASAIQSIFLLLFFSPFAGAVCTPVEPNTVVIACCAATGLVFLDPALGAAGCGRVRPADGWAVAPEAAAASAAVLKALVVDFSAATSCSAAEVLTTASALANSSPVWKRLSR